MFAEHTQTHAAAECFLYGAGQQIVSGPTFYLSAPREVSWELSWSTAPSKMIISVVVVAQDSGGKSADVCVCVCVCVRACVCVCWEVTDSIYTADH